MLYLDLNDTDERQFGSDTTLEARRPFAPIRIVASQCHCRIKNRTRQSAYSIHASSTLQPTASEPDKLPAESAVMAGTVRAQEFSPINGQTIPARNGRWNKTGSGAS